MKKLQILLCCLLPAFFHATAQPYLDLVNLRYCASPELDHAVAGFNLPIPLNKAKTDALLLMPYVEQWKVSGSGYDATLRGLGIPVGIQKTINDKWRVTAILFYRNNGSKGLSSELKTHQWGTAIIGNYIKSPALTYKFGMYYNREFYGNFFMLLLGLDWQINARNAIFGTLPGAITWESKASKRFYYGANFRAITNSYRYSPSGSNGYISIDENQLGAYADYCISKHIVLNAELGHSALRKVRTGLQDQKRKVANTITAQDNFYIRVMAAYRLRLR